MPREITQEYLDDDRRWLESQHNRGTAYEMVVPTCMATPQAPQGDGRPPRGGRRAKRRVAVPITEFPGLACNKIYSGDCVDWLFKLNDESIDLIFADPPFNIGYEYDIYDDRLAADKFLAWCGEWIGECYRVLAPNGSFWVAAGDEIAAELKVAASQAGLCLRNWVVWHYTFGVHCTKKFARSHTHLLYFVKSPHSFKFNSDSVRVPSARQAVYGDKRANPKGRVPDSTWILRPQDAPEAFGADSDTWYVPRVCGTFRERAGWHGCQMPEAVLERIISACSEPGDIVLDPFVGSGTTPAVAKRLGRRWIGFELSESYAARATERVESES